MGKTEKLMNALVANLYLLVIDAAESARDAHGHYNTSAQVAYDFQYQLGADFDSDDEMIPEHMPKLFAVGYEAYTRIMNLQREVLPQWSSKVSKYARKQTFEKMSESL